MTTAALTSSSDTTSTTSSSHNAQTTSATPVVSTQVITQSGSVFTQTVTTMPTSQSQTTPTKKSSNSAGLIAGVVVACVVALGAIGAAAFWFLRHRHGRRNTFIGADGRIVSSGFGSPQRPMSVSTGSALMANAVTGAPPRLNIPGDSGDDSPISPVDRRSSHGIYPFFHEQDSRLQPFTNLGFNESRTSFNDGADYSRRLQVHIPTLEILEGRR